MKNSCDAVLARIRDILFLEEFYNFDREQSTEDWDEITNLVRGYFQMPEIACAICGRSVWAEEAHFPEQIGPCCWDDIESGRG